MNLSTPQYYPKKMKNVKSLSCRGCAFCPTLDSAGYDCLLTNDIAIEHNIDQKLCHTGYIWKEK